MDRTKALYIHIPFCQQICHYCDFAKTALFDKEIVSKYFKTLLIDLKKEIELGNFREDLYHRLSVILIEVPALNKRTEDIPLLIHRFLSVIAKEQGTKPKKISEEAVSYLRSLPWTGNVRELRNVTERLTILGQETISLEDVKKYAR